MDKQQYIPPCSCFHALNKPSCIVTILLVCTKSSMVGRMVFTKSRGPLDAKTHRGSVFFFYNQDLEKNEDTDDHVFIPHSRRFLLMCVKIESHILRHTGSYLSCREVVLGCMNRWRIYLLQLQTCSSCFGGWALCLSVTVITPDDDYHPQDY